MAQMNQPNYFFFRPIHCYYTEKLICSLKNKSTNLNTIPVKILFLDFCKAFDCVNHEILLSKLNTYGILGITLDWVRSYLTDKKQ